MTKTRGNINRNTVPPCEVSKPEDDKKGSSKKNDKCVIL
jgi:hypothetical protein